MNGRQSRRDTPDNPPKFIEIEESELVQEVLGPELRKFPFRLRGIQNMTN